MANEHWQKIESIFEKAIELPQMEREAYLSEVCGDDKDLRRRIERLLLGDERAGDFIAAPVFAPTSGSPEKSVDPAMSLAILPFKILNSKASDASEYLSIGLSDVLITRLSHLRSVSVRPTSSILKFAGLPIEPNIVGQELQVTHVLDGRIINADNRFRITAQLIRIFDNETVWAEKFEEQSDDILSLQDTISAQVAESLVPELTGEERARIEKRGTTNAKANEAYLRGRFHWHTYTEEGFARAIVYFQEAIAHDENFAQAYSGVADYYNWLGSYGVLPPSECFDAAKEAAQKAIALDSSLAEAFASLAFAVWAYDWDPAESEKIYLRSIELNPHYAPAREWYSHMLGSQGRHPEAVGQMRRAQNLDPQSPSIAAVFAYCLHNARRYEESLAEIERSLNLEPNYHLALQGYGWVYPPLGRTAEALAPCLKAVELSGRAPLYLWTLGYVLALLDKKAEAEKIIAELNEIAGKRYVPPVYPAMIYTALGDFDTAFAWLDKALQGRDYWTQWLAVEPRFDPLRKDPRFDDYVSRIKPLTADQEIHRSNIETKISHPDSIVRRIINWFDRHRKAVLILALIFITV